jgi:hypothetical protein
MFTPEPGFRILIFCPSRIPDPGVKKRHRIPDPDPQHWLWARGSVIDPEMETANKFWTRHKCALFAFLPVEFLGTPIYTVLVIRDSEGLEFSVKNT